jgi:PTS system nitrogen regulatory IIA component
MLKRVLAADTVVMELRGETKDDVLVELVDVLAGAGRLPDRAAALRAIQEREKRMSTGLQDGVAIPHGKVDGVEGVVAAVGLKHAGFDFASLDGQPTQIVLMTLSAPARATAHIQFLAEISRRLHAPDVRDRLLQAADADEVIAILGENVTAPTG